MQIDRQRELQLIKRRQSLFLGEKKKLFLLLLLLLVLLLLLLLQMGETARATGAVSSCLSLFFYV